MRVFAIIFRGGYILALAANIALMLTVFRPVAAWELHFCLFVFSINLVSVVGFWASTAWSRNSEEALSLGRIGAIVFASATTTLPLVIEYSPVGRAIWFWPALDAGFLAWWATCICLFVLEIVFLRLLIQGKLRVASKT
ncbi:MAG TPA: hypothetical protein VN867_03785 [Candidatus Binataceae bacterium]|nr:hypothetical protein [Candidatus Binataceae bacterium]